jgi:hypothetical protein
MGEPQTGWFIMENPIKHIKMDDLGYLPISGKYVLGNIRIPLFGESGSQLGRLYWGIP